MFQRNSGARAMKVTVRNCVLAVFIACVQSVVAAPPTRGSFSPAAPLNLDYRIEHTIAAAQQNSVSIDISTRLDHGSLLVEIAKLQGVTALSETQKRFDLAQSSRPIRWTLPILPADQRERFLIVLLTVETEMGPMSRSFRIDLSDPAPAGDAPSIPD